MLRCTFGVRLVWLTYPLQRATRAHLHTLANLHTLLKLLKVQMKRNKLDNVEVRKNTHTQLGCGAQRMILLERTLMGVLHCPLGEPCSLGACVSNVLTCVVVIARCRISLRPSACNHKAQAHHCWQRARGCRGARDCSRDHVGRWRRWCCRNPD